MFARKGIFISGINEDWVLNFYNISINTMDKQKLIELYAQAWKELNPEIIIPYLSESFSYSSFWVFSSLDCEGYKEYFRRKLQTIRESGNDLIVKIGCNQIGEPAVVLSQGEGEPTYLTIKVTDGKIVEAYLCPF